MRRRAVSEEQLRELHIRVQETRRNREAGSRACSRSLLALAFAAAAFGKDIRDKDLPAEARQTLERDQQQAAHFPTSRTAPRSPTARGGCRCGPRLLS